MPPGRDGLDLPVIIAVPVVLMMQMTVHEVIDVIAMWYGFVSASRPVAVLGVVLRALMTAGAGVGVRRSDGNDVLLHLTIVRILKAPVVEVVHMLFVAYGEMTTIGPVCVSTSLRSLRALMSFGHSDLLVVLQFDAITARTGSITRAASIGSA